jgi:hypothetical protein
MSGSKSSAPGAGAPPEPVSLSVHGMAVPNLADPVQAQRRRTISGRIKMLLVLLICAAPVIASYTAFYVLKPQGRSNYATLIQPTRSLPALALQGLDGQAVPAASLRGQWLLVARGAGARRPRGLGAVAAPEPGRALEDHLYLVDPMGEWMMRMPAEPEPRAEGQARSGSLLRASASWDTPGR